MKQQLPTREFRPGDPAPPVDRDGASNAVACDANEWGVLAIAGSDATAFLQGQLSSDVKGRNPGAGQWTSYNSPKGRMLANGYLWRLPDGEGYRLALSADLAEPIRKRLAMFVLRSKVSIVDLSPSQARIGVGGPGAAKAVRVALGEAPSPGHAIEHPPAALAALPDGRILIVAPNDDAKGIRDRLSTVTDEGDAHAWRRLTIEAGTALVAAATQDLLLPQSANVDLLGGLALNVQKGCFPGQEIIKRTQALGQLKERLYAFHVSGAPPAPGARVFGATYGDQACGLVLQAAEVPEGGALLLASVQIRAAEADVLHLDAPDGFALTPRPLPYPVSAVVPRSRPA